MDMTLKSTVRAGITVGLSLGAIFGLVGCGDEVADDSDLSQHSAVASINGLALNGLTAVNGGRLSMDGFSIAGRDHALLVEGYDEAVSLAHGEAIGEVGGVAAAMTRAANLEIADVEATLRRRQFHPHHLPAVSDQPTNGVR